MSDLADGSVKERLVRIETEILEVKGLLQAIPGIVSMVQTNTESIRWIKNLGGMGITIALGMSGWATFLWTIRRK